MQTVPFLMMLVTNVVITFVTCYFFYKVLYTPLKDVDEDDAQFPRGG
jgi:hypothetical protein